MLFRSPEVGKPVVTPPPDAVPPPPKPDVVLEPPNPPPDTTKPVVPPPDTTKPDGTKAAVWRIKYRDPDTGAWVFETPDGATSKQGAARAARDKYLELAKRQDHEDHGNEIDLPEVEFLGQTLHQQDEDQGETLAANRDGAKASSQAEQPGRPAPEEKPVEEVRDPARPFEVPCHAQAGWGIRFHHGRRGGQPARP